MRFDTSEYPKGKNAVDPKRVKRLKMISVLATCTCILMYVSYIPQIIANFSGHPVSPIQPFVAMTNANFWVGYGWLKTFKDWTVIISNLSEILFGLFTASTVYIH